jgi:CHAT domain-containing protein
VTNVAKSVGLAVCAMLLIVACHDAKRGASNAAQQQLSAVSIDSIIQAIKNDTVNYRAQAAVQNIQTSYLLDEITAARLWLLSYEKDTSEVQNTAYLDSVLGYETTIKNDSLAKYVLSKAHNYKAYHAQIEGNFEQSVKNLEAFLLYSTPKQDSSNKADALIQLSAAYCRLGDYKKATSAAQNSYSYAIRIGNKEQAALACVSRVVAEDLAGNNSASIQAIREGLALAEPGQTRDILLIDEINYEQDLKIKSARAKSLLQKTEDNYIKFQCLNTLRSIAVLQKKWVDVIAFTAPSLATEEAEPREYAKCCLAASEAYAQLGQQDSALFYCDKGFSYFWNDRYASSADKIGDSVFAENTIYDLAIAKANILLTDKKVDSAAQRQALQYLYAARKTCGLLRKTLIFDESKYDMAQDLIVVTDKILKVHFSLYNQYKNIADAEQAMVVIENAKALSLQDHIESTILYYASKDSNYAKFSTVKKQLAEVELLLEQSNDRQVRALLQTQQLELNHQLSTFKNLSAITNSGADIGLNIGDIRQYAFKSKRNIVHYFQGIDAMYAVGLCGATGEIKLCLIDSNMLLNVETLCALQKNKDAYIADSRRFTSLSYEVYNNCFRPIADLSAASIICADGVLAQLAFDALLSKNTLDAFLIKDISITQAYSIAGLLRQRELPFCQQDSMLVFAPFCKGAIRNFASLPHTATEAQLIAKNTPCKTLLASAAQYKNLATGIDAYKYLHIATHATGGDTPRVELFDSSVRMESIYNIPMHQSLIYLNMCQAASGKQVSAEGQLSHARAFYSNGAHNVMCTYWNVDDASGAEIAQQFYNSIRSGKINSDAALQQAKLKYLQAHSKDEQAPYYWACVQHLGDGQLQAPASQSSTIFWIAGIAVAILLMSIFGRKIAKQLQG